MCELSRSVTNGSICWRKEGVFIVQKFDESPCMTVATLVELESIMKTAAHARTGKRNVIFIILWQGALAIRDDGVARSI